MSLPNARALTRAHARSRSSTSSPIRPFAMARRTLGSNCAKHDKFVPCLLVPRHRVVFSILATLLLSFHRIHVRSGLSSTQESFDINGTTYIQTSHAYLTRLGVAITLLFAFPFFSSLRLPRSLPSTIGTKLSKVFSTFSFFSPSFPCHLPTRTKSVTA